MGWNLKNICAVFDTDEEYARKLMNAMNTRKGIIYKTIIFTDEDALYDYFENETVQLLVIGEEIILQKPGKIQAEKTVILTENENSGGVYKYQPAEKLICEIVGENNKRMETLSSKADITGVYSPIHYAGKTSFSLALAKAYAKSGRRTLYLNLEEFSGLSEILPDMGEGNMSDALYCYRTNRERFAGNPEKFVCGAGNIFYIPPIKCAEDISSLDTNEWVEFISYIADTGRFEVIVLDAANAAREPWNLLEICTRVFMPVREDYISVQKIKDFDECMSALGREKICRIIEKVLLPRDSNAGLSKDFLDTVEYGTLGRHAQEIVRRN